MTDISLPDKIRAQIAQCANKALERVLASYQNYTAGIAEVDEESFYDSHKNSRMALSHLELLVKLLKLLGVRDQVVEQAEKDHKREAYDEWKAYLKSAGRPEDCNDEEDTWQQPAFGLFLSLWNRIQGNTTPTIHCMIADWLEARWIYGDRRVLLQAFRASGKSSLAGLFLAWLLTRDPDLRILVLSAESTLATKMARHIRTIIESHPLTALLVPNRTTNEWASNKFTVRRARHWRDPSVWSAGLFSNITGARADIILCDDAEVPNTCESAEARAALRARLHETEFILNPGGTVIYLGTPHCYETIYADTPRVELGEEEVFLKDYARLHVPLLNDKGESAWPQRFTPEDILLQKRQVGPMKFAAQMMLEPVNIMRARLDVNLLQRYNEPLCAREIQGAIYLTIGGKPVSACGAWWDPAFASAEGDASVLAIVFDDDEGCRYLHHVDYIHVDSKGDEARAQSLIVAELARRFYVPSITVETNGIGKFLPETLRNVLAETKTPCAVLEETSSRAKDLRILEGFDAVMAARALYVHDHVYRTAFVQEMAEWRPGLRGAKDDGLDAAAGALSLKPVRIPRRYYRGRQHWQALSHIARTDFPA